MTIAELKMALNLFSNDMDAEVKVESYQGWLKVIEVSFHNDVNTLLIHTEDEKPYDM